MPHPLLGLGFRHEKSIEHRHPAGHHSHLQIVLRLEKGDELGQGDVSLDIKAVPEGPRVLVVLVLGSGNGLGESKEGEGEVDEAILVILNLVLAGNQLVELEADKSGDKGGGGGNGGDNLPSDSLDLVAIARGDGVVHGTEIGSCRDEINMEIAVIVLLKVKLVHLEAGQGGGGREGGDGLLQLGLIGGLGDILGLGHLDLDTLLGGELGHHDVLEGGDDQGGIRGALDAIVLGVENGSGFDEIHVDGLVGVKVQGGGATLGAGPEGHPGGGDRVLGEVEEELLDGVVEEELELEAGPHDAVLEGHGLGGHKALLQSLDHILLFSWNEDRKEKAMRTQSHQKRNQKMEEKNLRNRSASGSPR